MFGCVSYHFVTLKMSGTSFVQELQVWMHHSGRTNFRKSFQNECPLHLITPKTHVWMRFVPFRYFENDRYEFRSGAAVWTHHSGRPNFHKIFHNERAQCTLLDPRLMFGCVSYHFVTLKTTGTSFAHELLCEWTILGDRTSVNFFTMNVPNALY